MRLAPTCESHPPLVMVHGMLDSSRVFNRLLKHLREPRRPLLLPDLPLRFGMTPIAESAALLGQQILAAFGPDQPIDLLGFSMGGVIARTWIQLLGGHRRTRRLISVGSPHQGTLTAMPWPRQPMAGIADLKCGSPLLQQLNGNLDSLSTVACCSFYSGLDLVVLPGWRAVLPVGVQRMLPVWTHPQLLWDRQALQPLSEELMRR
jgi:triacylglycerol lipase